MIERTFTRKGRHASGYFSLEGIRLHERALRAGIQIDSVLITADIEREKKTRWLKLLTQFKKVGTKISVAPDEVMHQLTNGRDFGHILGLIRQPQPVPLSAFLTDRPSPLLLTAVNIIDPGNVGAMVRTGHALGATALLAVGTTDPYHPRAVRTAMGSLFKLPVLSFPDWPTCHHILQGNNVMSVATVASGGLLLSDWEQKIGPLALLMGNEYHGLPTTISTSANYQVQIPMVSGVDSLSVNAATAVLLYALRRL